MVRQILVVIVGSALAFGLWAVVTGSREVTAIDSIRAPFPGCSWRVVDGAGLRVRVQECLYAGEAGYPDQQIRVAPSESLPGYFIEIAEGGSPFRATELAIQVFSIEPQTSINDLLPTLYDAGLPRSGECQFEKSYYSLARGITRYELVPTGLAKLLYQQRVAEKQAADPCGSYGVAVDTERYFEVQAAHPDTVLFVNVGAKQPLFDPEHIEIR